MEYDRFGIFLIWKRPEVDLPEMDRFHLPEMEYSLGIKEKENKGLWEDDRWGRPVIHTRCKENRKRGGKDLCTREGSKPGLPGAGLHSQPLG